MPIATERGLVVGFCLGDVGKIGRVGYGGGLEAGRGDDGVWIEAAGLTPEPAWDGESGELEMIADTSAHGEAEGDEEKECAQRGERGEEEMP